MVIQSYLFYQYMLFDFLYNYFRYSIHNYTVEKHSPMFNIHVSVFGGREQLMF